MELKTQDDEAYIPARNLRRQNTELPTGTDWIVRSAVTSSRMQGPVGMQKKKISERQKHHCSLDVVFGLVLRCIKTDTSTVFGSR